MRYVALTLLVLASPFAAQAHLVALVPPAARARLGLEAPLARLLGQLRAGDGPARAHARRQLVRLLGPAAYPALAASVRDGETGEAVAAVLALAELGVAEAVPLLGQVARDRRRREWVRVAAVLGLGRLGGTAAPAALGRVLLLPSLRARLAVAAAAAAARLGDPRLRPALLRRGRAGRGRPERPQAAALLALAALGEAPTGLLRRVAAVGDPVIRRAAFLAAAWDPAPGRLPLLRAGLGLEKNDPWTASAAALALGLLGGDRVRALLLQASRSRELPVRRCAARALAAAQGQVVAARLRELARDRAPAVRAAAWAGLYALGAPVNPEAALRDPEPAVRRIGVLLLLARPDGAEQLERFLCAERDPAVQEVALAAWVERTGRWLPAASPARHGPASRLLQEAPWRTLDLYPEERGAPPWRRVSGRLRAFRRRLTLPALRAELTNRWLLEALGLAVLQERGEPRGVLGKGRGREGAVVRRSRSGLSRPEEDLRLWLLERPYFE